MILSAVMTLINLTWNTLPYPLPSCPRSTTSAHPGAFTLCWRYGVGALVDPDDPGPSVWVHAGLDLGAVLSQWTWFPIP